MNGVETAIAAGTYKGDIVLTPTRKISKALYNGKMTKGENIDYRTGLFVDNGKIVDKSSVPADTTYLGDLINTPAPAVNNGMIVSLTGGTVWAVTGTSYLTSLTIDHSHITAPEGYTVSMTVNGTRTGIKTAASYIGDIVLSLVKDAD